MKYQCGTEVMLKDEVMVSCSPGLGALARVVAIGLDQAVDDIDPGFYEWAKESAIIEKESVVIEWVDSNPLHSHDSKHATVGQYMTLSTLCCESFVRRGER
jgi:hypothetical protein